MGHPINVISINENVIRTNEKQKLHRFPYGYSANHRKELPMATVQKRKAL